MIYWAAFVTLAMICALGAETCDRSDRVSVTKGQGGEPSGLELEAYESVRLEGLRRPAPVVLGCPHETMLWASFATGAASNLSPRDSASVADALLLEARARRQICPVSP